MKITVYFMGTDRYMKEIPILLEIYSEFGKKTFVLDHKLEWEKIQNEFNPIILEKRCRWFWNLLKNKVRYFDRTIINKKGEMNPCRECGSKDNLEIHHEGYFKDRKIMILCRDCHNKKR